MARFQMDIPEERLQELEELMNDTGISTKKELMNNALTLLRWAIQEREKGFQIASIDEDEGVYKQLQMPILDTVSGRKLAKHLRENRDG